MTDPNDGRPDAGGTVFDDEQPEVARTYAEALLGAAENEGQVEAVLDELDGARRRRARRPPRFAELLASPAAAAAEEKDRILDRDARGPGAADRRPVPPRAQPPRPARPARPDRPRRPGRSGIVARTAGPVIVRSAVPLDDGQRRPSATARPR